MSLTSEQELEMYADIKVIKQMLENHQGIQKNHEKRIVALERGYWIFVGVSSVITFVLPFIINYFLNGFCVMINNTNKIIFSIMWKQKMKN